MTRDPRGGYSSPPTPVRAGDLPKVPTGPAPGGARPGIVWHNGLPQIPDPLPPTIWPDCGTYAGAQHHGYAGEERCQDCQLAASAYVREWRRLRGHGYYLNHPIELRPDLADANLLGVVIARGMRESA